MRNCHDKPLDLAFAGILRFSFGVDRFFLANDDQILQKSIDHSDIADIILISDLNTADEVGHSNIQVFYCSQERVVVNLPYYLVIKG